MGIHQVVVIGAGPSGVAAAVSLLDRGLRPLLIDRADQIGSSWRGRYDRLKLNTGRPLSHLPNRRYPRGTAIFPTRSDVADHLDRHAREEGIQVRLGTRVDRIDPLGNGWRLQTSTGDIDTRQVVVATGYEHTPFLPTWPGMETFTGELLHSSEYRNPTPFLGKRVLVVGAGSSGMEIVHDVATGGAAKAWLSIRTPPNILPRRGPGGIPSDFIATPLFRAPPRIADFVGGWGRRLCFGDLTAYGLPVPSEGAFVRGARVGKAPAIVDNEVVEAIRARRFEVVGDVATVIGDTVKLTDGDQLQPDAVICATGYRRGLEPMVGHLDVLNACGVPRVTDELTAAPGLRFIGFTSRPGLIGYVAAQSKRISKQIAHELNSSPDATASPISLQSEGLNMTRRLPEVGTAVGLPSRMPPARVARAAESVRSALRRVSAKMLPPPASILDMTTGFSTAQTIFAAARLGIADVLVAGPLTASEVAMRIDADPGATHRLLRSLAMQSIFSERADGRFKMTSLAQALLTDSPMSIRPLLLMLGHPLYWEHWGNLTDSVRSGRTSIETVYGFPLFDVLDREPEVAQIFNDAMTCASAMTIPPVLAACDFSHARIIVDVGGGNGQLLAAVLSAAPQARGVLFEQESLEAKARKIFEAAGVVDRTRVELGSFFDAVPTGGDVYLLKHVIHDWDDDLAAKILHNVHQAMAPTASLFLIESVIPPRNKPHFGKYLDLDMLIFSGGKERTEREFSALLRDNGFHLKRVIPTVTHLSIIEATPV